MRCNMLRHAWLAAQHLHHGRSFDLHDAEHAVVQRHAVQTQLAERLLAERLLAERRPRRRASHALVWKRHAFSSRIAL